jgi:hypothetical protein
MRRGTLIALLLTELAGLAAPAGALDPSGRWEGSWSCSGWNGVKVKSSLKGGSVIAATDVYMTRDGVPYVAQAIADVRDPDRRGEVILIGCHTNNYPGNGPRSEMVRLKVTLDPLTGAGTMKGTGIAEDGLGLVSTCTYKYKRVNTSPEGTQLCGLDEETPP